MLIPCLIAFFASFLASILTFFTGFGLGTALLPALLLVCPLSTAIAVTALVHLINNLFKLTIVGKYASKRILLKFGLPALLAAPAGACFLFSLQDLPAICQFRIMGHSFQILPVKFVIAILIAGFAFLDLTRSAEKWLLSTKWLALGGLASGFFRRTFRASGRISLHVFA